MFVWGRLNIDVGNAIAEKISILLNVKIVVVFIDISWGKCRVFWISEYGDSCALKK